MYSPFLGNDKACWDFVNAKEEKRLKEREEFRRQKAKAKAMGEEAYQKFLDNY